MLIFLYLMKISELLIKYLQKRGENHQREIGRYWASDIYKILGGWLTPDNFFQESQYDKKSVGMIFTGMATEAMLERVFREMNVNFEPQVKKELKIGDEITLVVVADFVFPNFLIETKHLFKDDGGIPKKYLYQLEAQYQAFQKPVYLGKLKTPFDLELFKYTPSKGRWETIQKVLIDFHQKLKTKHYESSKESIHTR